MADLGRELLVIVLLTLANAFFAGAEIAVVSMRKTRLELLAEEGQKSARAVLVLKDDPERFLATIQIGITVVSATAAVFGGASMAGRIALLLAPIGWLAPYAEDIALVVVVSAVSYLSIVVGELVPKSLALRHAERYALLVGRPLLFLSWLARPLVRFLTLSSNLILRPFRDQTTFTETQHSAEELQQLVDEAAKAGTVDAEAGEIASRALDFARLRAMDVMVTRQDVVFLERSARVEEVQRVLLEHPHTRLPIVGEGIDDVIGYINVKDILAVAWNPSLFILEDLLRPAYFVPESLGALDLLQQMRERRMPFAIAVDEQGGTAGIVTMEDLLEELVGEIVSENAAEVDLIARQPDGSALVNGAAPVHEVNRALDLDLPESRDYTTIAGLCLALAGKIPAPGEKLVAPGAAGIEIVDATSRRVRLVRIISPSVSPVADPRATKA